MHPRFFKHFRRLVNTSPSLSVTPFICPVFGPSCLPVSLPSPAPIPSPSGSWLLLFFPSLTPSPPHALSLIPYLPGNAKQSTTSSTLALQADSARGGAAAAAAAAAAASKGRRAYQLGGKTFHLSEEEKNILRLTLGKNGAGAGGGGGTPMPELRPLPVATQPASGGSASGARLPPPPRAATTPPAEALLPICPNFSCQVRAAGRRCLSAWASLFPSLSRMGLRGRGFQLGSPASSPPAAGAGERGSGLTQMGVGRERGLPPPHLREAGGGDDA